MHTKVLTVFLQISMSKNHHHHHHHHHGRHGHNKHREKPPAYTGINKEN